MDINRNKFSVRNKFTAIALLIITVLIIYISLPTIISYIFEGPTVSFFIIHNHDVKSHEVTVEVFDQSNKLIINETYILGSKNDVKNDVSRSRPLSTRLPWRDEYTFKVTLDKQITNTTRVEVSDRRTSVDIHLYSEAEGSISQEPETHEIVPILIRPTKWM